MASICSSAKGMSANIIRKSSMTLHAMATGALKSEISMCKSAAVNKAGSNIWHWDAYTCDSNKLTATSQWHTVNKLGSWGTCDR